MQLKRAQAALARATASPENIERWLAVRTHGMPTEAKEAWFYLYFDLAEGRATTIAVTPGAVGADQGRSEAAGKRALRSLQKHGLCQIADRTTDRAQLATSGSMWKVALWDPMVVVKARPAGECEGQVALDFECEEEPEILTMPSPELVGRQDPLASCARPPGKDSSAEARALPPCPPENAPNHSALKDFKTSSFPLPFFKTLDLRLPPLADVHEEKSKVSEQNNGDEGTHGRSAHASAEPTRYTADGREIVGEATIARLRAASKNPRLLTADLRRVAERINRGELAAPEPPRHNPAPREPRRVATAAKALVGHYRILSPSQRLAEIDRLAGQVFEACQDARLWRSCCVEFAGWIVDGRWTAEQLQRVAGSTAKAYRGETKFGVPQVERYEYFVAACRRNFREHDRDAQ